MLEPNEKNNIIKLVKKYSNGWSMKFDKIKYMVYGNVPII